MSNLYERGDIRIQAASYYVTPDHNGAIRDDELTLPLSLSLTRDDAVKFVLNPKDVPEDFKEHRLDIKKANSLGRPVRALAALHLSTGRAAGLGTASAKPGTVWLGENRRFERPIQGGIRPAPKQSTSAHRLGKRSMEAKRRKTVTAHPPNRRRSHPPALHPSGTKRMSIKTFTNTSSTKQSAGSGKNARMLNV